MRRPFKALAWTAAALIAAPPLLAAGLSVTANIAAGRHAIERLTPRLTGGAVTLSGLGGRFPDAIRLARLELRDGDGPWLAIDGLVLDWSPLRLLAGHLAIERLAAERIGIDRLPAAADGSSSGGMPGFAPPLRLDLDDLRADRIALSPPLAGRDRAFSLHGNLHIDPMGRGRAELSGAGLEGPGSFALEAGLDGDDLKGRLDVEEPADGLIAGIAGLPGLGPLSLRATLDGPLSAARLALAAEAGPLTARAGGTLDLVKRVGGLEIAADAPAMTPADGLSWRSLHLDARIDGALARPDASGRLTVETLAAAGFGVKNLTVEITGDAGTLHLAARTAGLTLPGPRPDLLGQTPLTGQAAIDLDAPRTPVTFTLSHPLLELSGKADFGVSPSGAATVVLPVLAPFADAAGLDFKGHARLEAGFSTPNGKTALTLAGTLGADGAVRRPAEALIGEETRIDAAVTLEGAGVTVDHAEIAGRTLRLSLAGSAKDQGLDLAWKAALSDLSLLSGDIAGTLSAEGRVRGSQREPLIDAEAKGDLAPGGLPKKPFSLSLHGEGSTISQNGRISLTGVLGGEKIEMAANARPGRNDAMELAIEHARWSGAEMRGTLLLPPDGRGATGKLDLRLPRLADLRRLTGQDLAGSLSGTLSLADRGGRGELRLTATASDLALADDKVGHATLEGTLADPQGHPNLALRLAADDIAAGGMTGSASLDAGGPPEKLALRLQGALEIAGSPAVVSAEALLDTAHSRLGVSAMQARYCGGTARLLEPASVDFAKGVSLGGVRIGLGRTTMDLAGRLSPKFDLTASLSGTVADLPAGCLPLPLSQGGVTVQAKITGTPDAPEGSFQISGRDLRMRGAPTVAPAFLQASGEIHGRILRLMAELKAGKAVDFHLSGAVPLDPGGSLEMKATGALDLAMLTPILVADDRSVQGRLTLDAVVGGSMASPCVSGTADLTGGAIHDFSQGFALQAVNAKIDADCAQLRLSSFTAKAGPGTVSATGRLDLGAEGMPVDLTISASNARPLASDLLTADLDAEMTLRGPAAGPLLLAGNILVRRADINIPDSFASSVAVLDVHRPGEIPPPPPPETPLGLDLTLRAPDRIFVRGRGVDAELSGQIRIEGTSLDPKVSDGFNLRRGSYSLASKTLDFQSGRVAFDGMGVERRIDPTLHFVAQTSSGTVTATLTISGYADAPKIELSSTPSLPQDEILAQLLFGQSVKQLSPLQIAQIAQSVAALTNLGGGLDPLSAIRRGLGLDRLSTGGESGGSGASLQAGKYVAEGVYVGAQQGISDGTRAQVQIDLTEHLKLETTIGTGGSARTSETTTQNDPGSSVGLTYRFEY
ncbi:translocation/assembly module TamB domain-containing protein [Telmatospirillum siberiense]|uniref:Translocation and assembly module TamB C-terminal domain-containing protein n=1 Tax=Telmatospirillum siberiense TaxID=382514 RepID=A0A2N3PP62_9PROT|nr:translocation/assembly module TamB domain-containing protein [Telmatospirillum siberiense]PKU22154.1 hypothetical protein CWS72_23280 [Telmatospirillum siberiense]